MEFDSPLYTWNSPSFIKIGVENNITAHSFYESTGPLIQYDGQTINGLCNTDTYLNTSGDFQITKHSCQKKTVNGIPLALLEITAIQIQQYDYAFPENERISKQYQVALFQSTSKEWSGINLEMSTEKDSFTDFEQTVFDNIINSIRYTQ
jgi:hypothetical protein